MPTPTPRPRLEQQRTHERPHVLVVTDDPDLSEFLAHGLPLGGFWVSVIANGLQALEVFRLRQFDLLVVDGDMQSFDALEFLRRLRGISRLDRAGSQRTGAPVVIVATTPPAPGDLDVRLEIWAVMTAPLELEDLVQTLHRAFAQWRNDHPHAPLADSVNLAR